MKRKIKIKPFIILGIVILIGIISIIYINNYIKKINSYEYKLNKIGYSEKQIDTLTSKLNKKQLDILLTKEYNKNIDKFVREKYFIFTNLDSYIKYENNLEEEKDFSDIVAIVNVGSNKNWYEKTKKTTINLEEKMLVNKFNYLTKDYKPNDLIAISNNYAYGTNQALRKIAYDAYIEMFNSAKEDGITLIINSSYRSYEEQQSIYEDYSKWYGEEKANLIAAKPGFSEHQSGFAVDIQTFNSTRTSFETSDAFNWLNKNAYKFGFILRFPKGKEYLTGYEYESWHYRYVGKDIAKYIQKNQITYDEYYAYFLDKN